MLSLTHCSALLASWLLPTHTKLAPISGLLYLLCQPPKMSSLRHPNESLPSLYPDFTSLEVPSLSTSRRKRPCHSIPLPCFLFHFFTLLIPNILAYIDVFVGLFSVSLTRLSPSQGQIPFLFTKHIPSAYGVPGI